MVVKLVVLDFDGTLTEVEKEASPAVEGWKLDVGNELGLSASDIDRKWSEAQAKIEANPANYGWLMGNRIVAPAYADSLIMARTISELLFDEAGKYLNREEREDLLQNRFFAGNYGKMLSIFKTETDVFLRTLRKRFDVCIVTNSGTDGVKRKVSQLPSDHSGIPIYGDARKYVLNLEWKDVPESIIREGYGRPLFLQRQKYAAVLSKLMSERGLMPKQIAVVGDIYELDLLLPQYQGMHTILTPRESTPQFELNVVKASNLGHVATSLDEVVSHLQLIE